MIAAGDVIGLEEAIDESDDYPNTLYTIYLEEGEYLLPRTLVVRGTVKIYGAGADTTILRQVGIPGSQGGSMNTMIKVPGISLTLDNVTLTGGRNDDPVPLFSKGGAISVESASATLTVTNAKFIDNKAHKPANGYGGAIYSNGVVTLRKVYFEDNKADYGGAIALNANPSTGTAADIELVDFKLNTATTSRGGAIDIAAGTVWIANSNFRQNVSTATNPVRQHVYSYTTATAVVDARTNFWNNPTVASSANEKGVNTLNQLASKATFVFDDPEDPPPCGARGRQLCGPTPTPTATGTTATLGDYGIVLSSGWTPAEQAEILAAAETTGNALMALGVGSSAVEAFQRVLLDMNGEHYRQIEFTRISTANAYCTTTVNPSSAVSGIIACDSDVTMNRYTAVHEFGHVFVGRTGGEVSGTGTFFGLVEAPDGPGTALFSAGVFVFGPRTINVQGGSISDWQRSDYVLDNGWGSAAQWDQQSVYEYPGSDVLPMTPTNYPIRIPKIGPCGEGAPNDLPQVFGTPFPMQQNPCNFPDAYASTNKGTTTERSEAAADMFLNWVFWKNFGPPPLVPTGTPTPSGFGDIRWRYATYGGGNCYPNGCEDGALSGQARQAWMDASMAALFTLHDW